MQLRLHVTQNGFVDGVQRVRGVDAVRVWPIERIEIPPQPVKLMVPFDEGCSGWACRRLLDMPMLQPLQAYLLAAAEDDRDPDEGR